MPGANGRCQKEAGDREGNCSDSMACAQSKGAGETSSWGSSWKTMETQFIPITTVRESLKGHKQGSDRTGMHLERSPGFSRQVDWRDGLRRTWESSVRTCSGSGKRC